MPQNQGGADASQANLAAITGAPARSRSYLFGKGKRASPSGGVAVVQASQGAGEAAPHGH